MQAAHRAWLGEHGGAVVNISSVSGVKPAPGIVDVRRHQGDADLPHRDLAVELGPAIRVNAVAPGRREDPVRHPALRGPRGGGLRDYPLKRLGVPEDVAGAVAFLLSDDAAWLTGQTIVLDGGVTLTGGI